MKSLYSWLGALFLFSLLGLLLPGYYKFLYYEVAAWSLLALSVEILYGQAGMLSFGQSVFLALAGYVFLHLSSVPQVGFLGAALIAIAVATLFAAALGGLMVQLDGHYFVIATVILSLGSFLVASSLTNWTGGDDGLPVRSFAWTVLGSIPMPRFLAETDGLYSLVGLTAGAIFSLAWRLRVSSAGLLVAGVKYGPFRMKALGYPVFALRYGIWCVAASTSAAGGVLVIIVNRYASATQFHWSASGEGVVWAILGGVDTVWGAWLGAAVLVVVKDLLSSQFAYYPILVGVLLIGLVHFRSEGLLRTITKLTGSNKTWRRARSPHLRRAISTEWASRNLVDYASRGSVLKIEEVSKTFRGTVALDQCSLSIGKACFSITLHDGTFRSIRETASSYPALAIVGPNGAGKTTLLNVLCGYLQPDTGQVRSDVLKVEPKRVIPGIGRSFQEPQLWNELSVYENLLMGFLRDRPWRQLGRRIARDDVGASTAIMLASKLGLLDEMDKNASDLSFGKRKVLDIGVALGGWPEILVLDEPTAGVSPRELLELEGLIREMTRWIPVILVEHNLDVIRRLGIDVLFMAEGRFLACGSLGEVLSQEAVREQFAGLRVREE